MLAVLIGEDDCARAFYLCHRSIQEANRVGDVGVELGEDTSVAGHVVGGPGVEDPSMGFQICTKA